MAEFSELKGKTIEVVSVSRDNNEIYFKTKCGAEYKMFHYQDCCESVYIEDICGDITDLVEQPILYAEEVSNFDMGNPQGHESYTWTFYKIGGLLGGITIRWYGSSNGYYSEKVNFVRKNREGEYCPWNEDNQ